MALINPLVTGWWSMSDPLLSNLVFTKSTGRREGEYDTSFNDAIEYGQFPAALKIKGITRIEVYSDKKQAKKAIITGLIIYYDGVDQPVSHGLVVNVDRVGAVDIDSDHLLVGAYGRLKDLKNQPVDKRINSIGFVLFDKSTGTIDDQGPFEGSTEYRGTPWASFGTIIAFQGTKKDGVGITTLGFVKADGPFSDVEIVQKSNVRSFAHVL